VVEIRLFELTTRVKLAAFDDAVFNDAMLRAIRAIAEAQEAGKISDRFAPVDPLALVLVSRCARPVRR
jgi:hypothetical protein